ncbi:MAG: hypothetical protein DDT37_01048 [Firmicutes bacterium]|nr:hypothetical protein [candidate division NPL-UPA2 bacterium]MBT9156072.1 hypothetical protein [candidate division NPL-UPA2 bacterium]
MGHFAALELHLRQDPGQRGLAQEHSPGTLALAAERLLTAGTVVIATGFYIPSAQAVESDGPPGAAFLARALEHLGKAVVILCAESALQAMEVCRGSLGLRCEIVSLQPGMVSVDLWHNYPCQVFVALEYPGQGSDGKCRNMRGVDISPFVPMLDKALAEAQALGIFTIAIGDGGNELGCGRAGRRIPAPANGASIAAVSDARAIVCAGVSNWGAYALIAALSVLQSENFLPAAAEEQALLQSLCEVGVVDGCTARREPTVDGLSAEVCAAFLRELNALTAQYLESQATAAPTSF